MSEFVTGCAAALYSLEEESGPALGELLDKLLGDQSLWQALVRPAVPAGEREELLRSAPVLAGREELTAFLLMLARENKLEELPDVVRELKRLELAGQGGRCAS